MRPVTETATPAPEVEAELGRLRAENLRLMERVAALEILADRDPLTTALNRRAFMRELHRVVGFCQRYRSTVSVVFFDMDGLKSINDAYGHAAGDIALQTVVATLAAHVRESDVVGRLGGDEFAVILAQADRASATAKAQSLTQLIETEPAGYEGRAIPLKISFGVREFERGISAAELLAGADAAMYLYKNTRK